MIDSLRYVSVVLGDADVDFIKEMKTSAFALQNYKGLRKWLKGYVESHPQQPTTVLSRAQYIGVSRRALDSYIAGTYFLPKDEGGEGVDPKASKIEHAIRAFRERVDGSPRRGYGRTFVETRTWFQAQKACATAIAVNRNYPVRGLFGALRNITRRTLRWFAAVL